MVLRRRLIVVGVLMEDINRNIIWCYFGYGFVYEIWKMKVIMSNSILVDKS